MYTIESPMGPLLLQSDGEALTGVTPTTIPGDEPTPLLLEVERQLKAYFAGTLRAFDLPLAPRGTPFQHQVWRELLEIPHGHTTSYGALAARLGTSARAVGSANGRNPIAIVIPCHRVIGADGGLTGYAGGLERKAWLLQHELYRPG